jgi:hypothetical protein
MKRLFFLIISCVILSCNVSAPSDRLQFDSTKTKEANERTRKIDSASKASLAVEKSNWDYSEDEDKMTSKKNYFASVDAPELLQMSFPYNGGVVASLLVQHRRGENNVLLKVSKGQIQDNDIRIRFDDGRAESFNTTSPSDGDTEYAFIEPASRIIAKLKKAKHIVLEAQFFNNGVKQIEFNVEGFKWNH